MTEEKKKEYYDYINLLYEEIEKVKLIDTLPEEEIQKEIDSIYKMIDELKSITERY